MKFYFAPMEGSTGYVYRNVHHALFGEGIARYYAPFVVATYTKKLKTREKQDVLPENNAGIPLVPQILANDAAIFLYTARSMAALGYQEVNLNLGCPVGTVVSKHKGAGLLQFPDELDRFLDGIFNGLARDAIPLRISVKTRLGFHAVSEADTLFEIFARYPIAELIVHARTRDEQYRGQPELPTFLRLCRSYKGPLCYNGNIASVRDVSRLASLPVNCMIGRGLLANPGLVREIVTGRRTTKQELRLFHDQLYAGYLEQYASFRGQSAGITVVLNRMKEVWTHLGDSFLDEGHYRKNIHKARTRAEYEAAVRLLFANCAVTQPPDGLSDVVLPELSPAPSEKALSGISPQAAGIRGSGESVP